MAFDATRYEREIIRPLRGQTQLPDGDLLARYAIEPGMSAAQLEAHLRQIRAWWNQNSSGHSNKAQVCRLLLAADEDLQRRFGSQMLKPEWWADQARRHDQQVREQVSRLATELATAYAGVRKITRDQLQAIMQHQPALGPAHVDEAIRKAGLQVVDPIELPQSSGLDRTAYRRLCERLGELNAPTIVQLLHPTLTQPFRLVPGFAVVGGPPLSLDRAIVEQRGREAEAAADSGAARARKEALGILLTGLNAGADLRTIALFQIVEKLRTATNLAPELLVSTATRLGLHRDDAELLVLSLPAVAEPTTSPADEVRDLLAEGRLRAAQQALAALSDKDPDYEAVRALVETNRVRVENLVREATAAATGGREDEARRKLLEAHTLAQDDADIEGRLRRLPVPAPRALSAVAAGQSVQLGWQAPPSAEESVRYRVVRTEGREAASAHDGALVAETKETSCVDPRPPVARELRYAVFASADGATWSRPAHSRGVIVLPAVTNPQVRADADRVTVTWSIHPDAVMVRVRRTIGRPPAGASDGVAIPATTTSVVDTAVQSGQTHHYAIVPLYRDPRGREVEGDPVLISATPRAAAAPVTGLEAEVVSAANGIARIRLRWPRLADGNPVTIRYAERPPQWNEGSVRPVAEIERYGREAAGRPDRRGDHEVLEIDVPAGFHVFVPFAIGGTGAVVGRPVGLGVAEAVRALEIRATGAIATISWVWPPEVHLAEVEWAEPDGTQTVRRVTRGQFTAEGGVKFPLRPHGAVATVRSVSVGALGEAYSPPVVATAPAYALRLSYRIIRPPLLRRFGGPAPWTLQITAENDCTGVDVTLVVAPGIVMPMRPDQGVVVQQLTGLTLTAGVPLNLEFTAPRTPRPYWIKCFVTNPPEAMVIDPPVDELKVR